MNYRNKTCFDWNDYKRNNISSIQSLDFMDSLKSKLKLNDIKNVIVRNINSQLGVVIQHINDIDNKLVCNIVYEAVKELNLELKYFAFHQECKGVYSKNSNYVKVKDQFLEFEYCDKKILLLPDSFFQPNINMLDLYYKFFRDCINFTKCKNMINIGDDGGNIGTILSNDFNNIICYLHCPITVDCLKNMIIRNNLRNVSYCTQLDDLIDNTSSAFTSSTLIFINPGRNGLKEKEHIYLGIKRFKFIIYMACEKKAFKKDFEKMNYDIVNLQEIATMPNTKKIHTNYLLKIKSQIRCSK